jgi:NAD(P)-dependent dehydrogenase (short-subunit alcohol dehydrogenase family)
MDTTIALRGKRVLVTGGSEGLGLAMVRALRRAGAEVTALARHRDKLAAAEQAGALVVAGDATDAALMQRLVSEQPDAVILNAGARLPMAPIDELSWDDFSQTWNVDVKAGLVGIQAALKAPLRAGARVMVMSSGAARVLSLPGIKPEGLRLSGGYIGAKRALWFMAHSANAVSRERGLGIHFQALLPGQLIGATALGHAVASAYAKLEGLTADEYLRTRYGEPLAPDQVGAQVVELLTEPRYATGVAYGFRSGSEILSFDVNG